MNRVASYFILTCLAALLSGCFRKNNLPELRETFAYKDTRPFGGFVAKEILQQCYPDNYVQAINEPFAKASVNYNDTSAVYFCITRNLFTDEQDVSAILDFVYAGNTAFFSASRYDTSFMNRIYCETAKPSALFEGSALQYRNTSIRLMDGIHTSADRFGYYYKPFESHFSQINDIYCRVTGYNESGKPNCIVFFWGKGKLFLHTDPYAFSNYFLLTRNNYRYMQELVQVMNETPEHVIWDDYYNRKNYQGPSGKRKDSLSGIFRYPGLKTAFLLMCTLLLLFVLFGIKRKQRIIRVIRPNQNSSVAFTETVARLYLQKHDNRNIADKMITYFFEFVRNSYFLHLNTGNNEFIMALSRKSGVSEEDTRALFNTISSISENNTVSDGQLLALHEQIQQFHKKRK